MNVSSNQNVSFGKNPNEPQKVKNKGAFAGLMTETGVSLAAIPVNLLAMDYFLKADKFTPKERVTLNKAIDETLKSSGLAQKGVEIVRLNSKPELYKNIVKAVLSGKSENIKEAIDSVLHRPLNYQEKRVLVKINQEFKKKNPTLKQKLLTKNLDSKTSAQIVRNMNKKGGLMYRMLEGGINAFYAEKGNRIFLSKNSINSSGFHEMGHAMNANFSKIGKALQKARPLMKAAPLIALISIFSRTKHDTEDKKVGIKGNVVNFIRENAGKLVFASFVPTLIEEGMATYKGNKLAKKALSPEMFKKIKFSNAKAYLTYLGAAVFTTLAVKAGVAVKDKIQAKHEAKVKAHNEAIKA